MIEISGSFTGASQTSAVFSPPVSDETGAGHQQRGTAALLLYGAFSGAIQLGCGVDGTNFPPCAVDGSGTPNSFTAPVAVFFDIPMSGLLFQLSTPSWSSGTAYYVMRWSPGPDSSYRR